MALVISDTNIFIDFEEGGLIKEFFEHFESVGVPDMLFEDELRDTHEHLLGFGLQLVVLNSNTMQRVVELSASYKKTSRHDLMALATAEQESCALITGDGALRKAAQHEGLEVRGSIWIMKQLRAADAVSGATARSAFAKMRSAGRRLPWGQVEEEFGKLSEARL